LVLKERTDLNRWTTLQDAVPFSCLESRTMDKVQNSSNPKCYITSSQRFRFDFAFYLSIKNGPPFLRRTGKINSLKICSSTFLLSSWSQMKLNLYRHFSGAISPVPMRSLDMFFSRLRHPSSSNGTMGLIQPLIEMSTRNILVDERLTALKSDNLSVTRKLIVQKCGIPDF
jgi:hypothetical protein